MLVRLLTGALTPPLFGVGGRSRQLGGGSLGSGGGLVDAFSLEKKTKKPSQAVGAAVPWAELRLQRSVPVSLGEERQALADQAVAQQQEVL